MKKWQGILFVLLYVAYLVLKCYQVVWKI
jgi:hypothetical protein